MPKKKLPVYEVLIDEENFEESGVHAISLVSDPAMEKHANFIMLEKEHALVELATVDEEKRILMAAVMIPNKPIYREDENEKFYIMFSKDTIVKASQLYLKKGHQNNSTLQHMKPVEGVSTVESWIKEDMEKDKSALYGINAPVGSWIVAQKVDNDDIWEKAKNGEIKGYSLEGYFLPDKREELSKNDPDEKVIDQIKQLVR